MKSSSVTLQKKAAEQSVLLSLFSVVKIDL